MKYLYIPGFGNAKSECSKKAAELKEMGEVIELHYDNYAECVVNFSLLYQEVEKQMKQDPYGIILVGSSLGAFFAYHLSLELRTPSILINPALDPCDYFISHGICINVAESYRPYAIVSVNVPYEPVVLLDKGDRLFDWNIAHSIFRHVIAFEGGNHQFTHMKEALPYIREYANIAETSCTF